MAFPNGDELVVGGGAAATGFVLKWLWDRFWRKKDDSTSKQRSLESRMDAVEIRETERQKHIGQLEANHNRLDGKLDGLQTFWRGEFSKLSAEFSALEEKIDYRLDNLRLELRGDQQKTEDRLTELLTAHQARVHDRLNAISVEQAKMLNELVDMLADRAGEPRSSPPKTGGTPT